MTPAVFPAVFVTLHVGWLFVAALITAGLSRVGGVA